MVIELGFCLGKPALTRQPLSSQLAGFEYFQPTLKSTDGTASHWKYITGNVNVVSRCVSRLPNLELRRATADRSFKAEIRCSRGMRT
jgi:hypothetical protein